MRRRDLLRYLSDRIAGSDFGHPLRVAVDGVDAAGKTTLADDLATLIEEGGRQCIRTGIDGFHNPRSLRYRQGPTSPVGYFEDSFDTDALKAVLLEPLGPNGSGRFRSRVFDHVRDLPLAEAEGVAHPDSVLLFDGVFLLRSELAGSWDLSIFLKISFETVLDRALARDVPALGTAEEVRQRYMERYIPGQQTYLTSCEPDEHADILIDNDEPESPLILRR